MLLEKLAAASLVYVLSFTIFSIAAVPMTLHGDGPVTVQGLIFFFFIFLVLDAGLLQRSENGSSGITFFLVFSQFIFLFALYLLIFLQIMLNK